MQWEYIPGATKGFYALILLPLLDWSAKKSLLALNAFSILSFIFFMYLGSSFPSFLTCGGIMYSQ